MKKDRRGFTLLEVLISVTISAVILLSLYSVWTTGMQLSHRHDQTSEKLQEINWTFDQIEKDIGRITDYDYSGSYKDQKSFAATSDTMVFIMTTPEGLKAVRYALEEVKDDARHEVKIGKTTKKNINTVFNSKADKETKMVFSRIQKDFVDYLSTGFEDKDPREILLEELGPQNVSFSFASLTPGGKVPTWKTEWAQAEWPLSIRVELNLKSLAALKLPTRWRRDFFMVKGLTVTGEK